MCFVDAQEWLAFMYMTLCLGYCCKTQLSWWQVRNFASLLCCHDRIFNLTLSEWCESCCILPECNALYIEHRHTAYV